MAWNSLNLLRMVPWQALLVLPLVTMNQIMNTRATITLTSSVDGRQAACPGEVVTYTCSVTQTTNLDWTAEPFVPSSSIVRFVVGTHNEQATQSCGDFPSIQCTDIDFQATLTSVGPGTSVADLTSTFMFTAAARLNGTVVLCSGSTAGGVLTERETFNIAGIPSLPLFLTPPYTVQHYGRDTVLLALQWQPPQYDSGAPVNYTITVTPNVISITTHGTNATVTLPYNVPHTVTIMAANCVGSSSAVMETIPAIVNCSDPNVPGNGSIQAYLNTTEGAEIFFGCRPGFVPAESMRAVCASDGQWNPDPATHVCTVSCGEPSFASGVAVEPYNSTTVGSEIFYQCQPGLQPEGRRTSVCGSNGRWNLDPAILLCGVNCGVPAPPGNGSIVNYTSTMEGSVIYYQCNLGFGPLGEMSVVCAANGSWSPDPADVTCREVVDCGPPTTPWNGSLESYSDTTEGSVVLYRCDPGLVPEEKMRTMCTENGWSPNPADLNCFLGMNIPSSCSTSNAISAVVSCAVTFIITALVGAVIHYCAVRKKSNCQKFYSLTIARKQQKQQPAPLYDDIVAQKGTVDLTHIELRENIAYGPVQTD